MTTSTDVCMTSRSPVTMINTKQVKMLADSTYVCAYSSL